MTDTRHTNIIRAPRGAQRPYFSMARSTAQDSRLSFVARGVLAYILSKPDDWQVKLADIMREGGIGRDRANNALKELRDCGYLVTEITQGDDGKFNGKIDRVYEVSQTPHHDTEKPSHGETVKRRNRNIHNTESLHKTEKIVATQPSIVSYADRHPEMTDDQLEALKQKRLREMQEQEAEAQRWKDDFLAMEAALDELLPGVAGKVATQYAHMLRRTARKGEWKEYMPLVRVWSHEFRQFVAWYKKRYPDQSMAKQPDILHGYLMEWINAGKPDVSNLTPMFEAVASIPATHVYANFTVFDDDGTYIGVGMEAQRELERRRLARKADSDGTG